MSCNTYTEEWFQSLSCNVPNFWALAVTAINATGDDLAREERINSALDRGLVSYGDAYFLRTGDAL